MGHRPLPGPLVDKEFSRLPGQGRHHLHGAGPRADDGNPLAGDIQLGIPFRSVQCRPGERVRPGDHRNARPVEVAYGTYEYGTGDLTASAIRSAKFYLPPRRVRVPRRPHDLDTELDVVVEAVLAGQSREVVVHLVALAEIGTPPRAFRE